MKFIIALAAITGAVSAISPRQAEPSATPEPEYKDPITCRIKDNLNGICEREGQILDWSERNEVCCQWLGECGPGVDKCVADDCCEDKPTPTSPPEPETTTVTVTITEGDVTETETEVIVIHPSSDLVACGITVNASAFNFYTCNETALEIVNYPKQCCSEESENAECGNDVPFCSEEQCCVNSTELPEHVHTCETMHDMFVTLEHSDETLWGYETQYCSNDEFMTREDGYLCCRFNPEGPYGGDCLEFGIVNQCTEASCCVPMPEFEDQY